MSNGACPAAARERWTWTITARALGCVLIVCFHAAIPYMEHPLPGLLWVVRNDAPSPVADALGWAIQAFTVPLFFFLGGMKAGLVCEAPRPGRALLQRGLRLLGLLAVGGLTVLPATLYVWVGGWVITGEVPLQKLFSLRFDPQRQADFWGPGHLWFLEHLLIYNLLFAVAAAVASRWCNSARLLGSVSAVSRPWLLVVVVPLLVAWCAVFLRWEPRIVLGFQNAVLPPLPKLLYFLSFFVAGAGAARRRAAPLFTPRTGVMCLILGCLLLLDMIPLIHDHLETARVAAGAELRLMVELALYAWLMIAGVCGVCAGGWSSPPELVRALAGASLWIFVAHLPFVGLMQLATHFVPCPPILKFFAVVLGALLLVLATRAAAHWMVKRLAGLCQICWRRLGHSTAESSAAVPGYAPSNLRQSATSFNTSARSQRSR